MMVMMTWVADCLIRALAWIGQDHYPSARVYACDEDGRAELLTAW
jgi:hypothetical protein